MIKIENRRIIRRFALHELKFSRKMNFMVILSIILTCVLFTAITLVGGSLINETQQETMRQVGGDRMAGVKYVLPEDYEKIITDNEVRDTVCRILVGQAVNKEFKNISVEVNYTDDAQTAESMFCNPQTGRLPEEYNEIAVSTLVLDALRLPHELGIVVPVTLDVDGTLSEHEFILCGYWRGEPLAMAQQCWVSKSFTEKYAPTPAESFYTQEYPKYAGYYMVDFNFSNSWDIEGKLNHLLARIYGDTQSCPAAGVNWAYTTSSVDSGTALGVILMILIIFTAGYLIIYNIFHINISAHIRSYGLLKTIGTTAKQIRRIVRVQAAFYSAVGIPAGLCIGILLGRVLLSSVRGTLDTHSAENYAASAGLLILICLISALFTFATVMISCQKPCSIAGSVSPIEALRYNETDIRTKKKGRKTKKVTPLLVAQNNMSRGRKKTTVVVLSLTLSLIVVNTLVTALKGFDIDKYISTLIVGDFIVMRNQNSSFDEKAYYCITPEEIAYLKNINGAKETELIYFEWGTLSPTGRPLDRLSSLCEQYGSQDEYGELQAALDGELMADIYGITSGVLQRLHTAQGTIDARKFASGEYAIVYTQYIPLDEKNTEDDLYEAGDQVTLTATDGQTKTYEVMAVCEMPYAISKQSYSSSLCAQIMIPDSEYFKLTDNTNAMTAMIDADEGRFDEVDAQIRTLTDSADAQVILKSKKTYTDEYENFVNMIKLVGGTLSSILALIGILNFINAVVTGILARKRELAMMNAVGMTGRQLRAMLMWESMHYVFLTAVCTLLIGTLISYAVVNVMVGETFFFTYHFTILPILICIPILLLLSAVIPAVSYRTILRDSVVNRLREN